PLPNYDCRQLRPQVVETEPVAGPRLKLPELHALRRLDHQDRVVGRDGDRVTGHREAGSTPDGADTVVGRTGACGRDDTQGATGSAAQDLDEALDGRTRAA